jgi:hypothetical protein
MERLFNDKGRYTERGLNIDLDTQHALQKVLNANPDVDIRDLSAVFYAAVSDVICMQMIGAPLGPPPK